VTARKSGVSANPPEAAVKLEGCGIRLLLKVTSAGAVWLNETEVARIIIAAETNDCFQKQIFMGAFSRTPA
jgi:hypothetical protein